MSHWTTGQRSAALSADPQSAATATGRTLRAVYAYRFRAGATRTPTAYTPADDAVLTAGREAGETWQEIADKLGRTVGSVRSRVVALERRKSPKYRLNTIISEYAKGHGGAKRAAAILGMSHAAVRKMASRHGVAKCRKK